MHLRRNRPAAVLALVLGLVASADAQTRPTEFDGWVIPGWSFTPSVSFSGLWDSNVALADTGEGVTPASDRLFTIEPQGQFEFRSPRTEFIAGYKGYLRRYVTAEELDGFDQRGYVSLRHAATRRLSLYARNDFDDVPTTDELQLNGLPFTRFGARSNRASAGVDFRVTKLSDLTVHYENVWVAFDHQALLRGGRMHGMGSRYSARLSERTRVGGEYRMRHSNINDDARIMWFHDMGGLVEQALSPHVRIAFAAGYSIIRDPESIDRNGGLYMRSDLTRATERLTMGVGYEHSYAPSFGFGGSTASRELRGHVHMPFARNRFYVNGSGSWRRTDPLLAEELELDSFFLDGTLGYGLSRWLRVQTFYQYSRQDSRNLIAGEINRQRAGVEVVISQPMRIR
jgi:hypothetical protein